MTPNSPLPPTSLPFLQQEYLQAALQDNGAQLPAAESPVALTNVASTEQGTLCSCIRVKYLLFISAKARKKRRGKRRAAKEEVRVIKTGGDGGKWAGGCGDTETIHDNQVLGFSAILLYISTESITCQIVSCTVRSSVGAWQSLLRSPQMDWNSPWRRGNTQI